MKMQATIVRRADEIGHCYQCQNDIPESQVILFSCYQFCGKLCIERYRDENNESDGQLG